MARHYLGVVHYQRNELDAALPLLEASVKVSAHEPEFHNNLGLAYAAADREAEALAAYRAALIIQPDHAHIVDLKYGRGVAVSPDSPQLKLYGLGFVESFFARVEPDFPITLTVCQPRVPSEDGPLRSHTTTLEALREWRSQEVVPAVKRIRAGDATEQTGHWCRWCVRRTVCVAFNTRHQSHAAEAFDD